MIEFIYAIVGIVWLTQYYTSCNDLTAKNVTLGMLVGPGVEGPGQVREGSGTDTASLTLDWGLPQWLSGKRIHLRLQKTKVRSLGQEDLLEEEMATYSIIFAWEIPWTEEPGYIVHGVSKSQTRLK